MIRSTRSHLPILTSRGRGVKVILLFSRGSTLTKIRVISRNETERTKDYLEQGTAYKVKLHIARKFNAGKHR